MSTVGVFRRQAHARRMPAQLSYRSWHGGARNGLIKAQALVRMQLAHRRYVAWYTGPRVGLRKAQARAADSAYSYNSLVSG